MHRLTRFVPFALLLAVAVGCGPRVIQSEPMTGVPRAPRGKNCSLTVVLPTEVTTHFPQHEAVGLITIEAPGHDKENPVTKAFVRARACELGGDVISIMELVDRRVRRPVGTFMIGVYAPRLPTQAPQAF